MAPGELRTWLLLLAGVAYWANVVRTFPHDPAISLGSIAQSVLSEGGFNVAAWVVIAIWAGRVAPKGVASAPQVAGALAIGLLCAVPTRQATVGALIALGIIIAIPPRTYYGRNVAALLFGLAIQMIWVSTYLLPFHAIVATFDAHACAAILGLLGQNVQAHGNLLENVQTGFNIEVWAFCASSFLFGGVCFAFLMTILYCDHFPRLADLRWLALSLLASVALTETRLCLMAQGEANYTWLHYEGGVIVYTLFAVALAILFPVIAMNTRTREPRME